MSTMLLADMDWAAVKDIVQTVAGVATLLIGAGGSAWAIYMTFRQKKVEADLELARIAANDAKATAQKEGRRNRRKVKVLTDETVRQTEIMTETKAHVEKIDKQTNGTQEALVRLSHEEGKRQGATEEKARITEVASEVAKAVTEKIASPQTIVNVPDGGSLEVTDTSTHSKIVIPPNKP